MLEMYWILTLHNCSDAQSFERHIRSKLDLEQMINSSSPAGVESVQRIRWAFFHHELHSSLSWEIVLDVVHFHRWISSQLCVVPVVDWHCSNAPDHILCVREGRPNTAYACEYSSKCCPGHCDRSANSIKRIHYWIHESVLPFARLWQRIH